MQDKEEPRTPTTVAQAVAMVAAGIGGMKEVVSNEYALTVGVDGFVSRQLVAAATGDDFWVGTKHSDSRSGKPDGETVMGKHFSSAEVVQAIAFGTGELDWAKSVTAEERRTLTVTMPLPQQVPFEVFKNHAELTPLINHGRAASVRFHDHNCGFVDFHGIEGLRQAHFRAVNNALHCNLPRSPAFAARPLPSPEALADYPELVQKFPAAAQKVMIEMKDPAEPNSWFRDPATGTCYPSQKSVDKYLPEGHQVVPCSEPHMQIRTLSHQEFHLSPVWMDRMASATADDWLSFLKGYVPGASLDDETQNRIQRFMREFKTECLTDYDRYYTLAGVAAPNLRLTQRKESSSEYTRAGRNSFRKRISAG